MLTKSLIHGRATLLLVSLAFAIPGCKNDDDDPGEGTTGDQMECPLCAAGQETYLCIIEGREELICFPDFATAQATCGAVLGNGVVGDGPVPCDNHSGGADPSPEIGGQIAFDSVGQVYEVDQEFVLGLLENPSRLLHDRARLEWRGEHFEFETIAPGDIVEALGFVNGDELLEINGHPLSTMEEITGAYEELLQSTTFAVVVARGEATVVLRYRLTTDGE